MQGMGMILVTVLLAMIICQKYKKSMKGKNEENYKIHMMERIIIMVISFLPIGIMYIIISFIGSSLGWYTVEETRSYDLVSFDTRTSVEGNVDGSMFLLCGSVSGEITSVKKYEYWYKRSDGGILPGSITADEATIVVYETNEVKPQYVIYEGTKRVSDDIPLGRGFFKFFGLESYTKDGVNEYRFYVPEGTFVKSGSYEIE